MKTAHPRLKKIFLIFIISIMAIVVVCILFMSPIAKYLIEKYDTKYTGREIKLDWVYVNPFTGYINIHDLKIFESKKDTLFFSAKSVSADFAMYKMLFKTYEIAELNIDQPWGIIIQNKKVFNFTDLIERFSSKQSDEPRSPVHFNILSVRITNGEFHYKEKVIPINYFIKKVNIESTGKRWNADTIASKFSFVAGSGNLKGNFTINTTTQDYRFATDIHNLDLELIRQYLWELINYGMFRAHLDANISAMGNFQDQDSIILKGRLAINDFHLGKTTTQDYASFKKLVLVINELSPEYKRYFFDSVAVINPFFSYERFDSLNNIEAMFGKKGSNISDITKQSGRFNLVIELSRYINTLAKKFFESQYNIKRLSITNGDIKFSDYSLNEKFSIQANAINISADSINKTNKRVKFYLHSGIYPYGKTDAMLSLNPRDSGYFDLTFRFQKIPITIFNPYVITYTSFPLNKGILDLEGMWNVRNGIIKSENNIVLTNPRIATRIKSKDTKRLPLPLIMSFVRERGNVINYKIPITGNLKNPKFHLQDVIVDLLENILIKPPTIPYGIEVKNTEKEIEESISLTWPMRQYLLEPRQEKFLREMASFLKENKGDHIDVYPQQYELKEKEHILFFETKKKYFLLTHHKHAKDFNTNDSIEVDKMSIKDISHFLVKDLKKITRDTTMFTIQDKCNYFLADDVVNNRYNQLIKARENSFKSFFAENGIDKRVIMHSEKSIIPYNGFSFYKVQYHNMPESLKKAYKKMNEFKSRKFL